MVEVKNEEKLYHKIFKYISTINFYQTNLEIISE